MGDGGLVEHARGVVIAEKLDVARRADDDSFQRVP
jgi:hypothetical protein